MFAPPFLAGEDEPVGHGSAISASISSHAERFISEVCVYLQKSSILHVKAHQRVRAWSLSSTLCVLSSYICVLVGLHADMFLGLLWLFNFLLHQQEEEEEEEGGHTIQHIH